MWEWSNLVLIVAIGAFALSTPLWIDVIFRPRSHIREALSAAGYELVSIHRVWLLWPSAIPRFPKVRARLRVVRIKILGLSGDHEIYRRVRARKGDLELETFVRLIYERFRLTRLDMRPSLSKARKRAQRARRQERKKAVTS